ncbi:Iron-type alcohol dehydrogenase-like protein [Aduncisulcus paluster]|uniref:Iron-type alcohol dehydrogenase-like protein n=1 Tax=Aduncisulcus paluster TaxID=2918883 RepID=A0ABQ5JSY6_9EUKA|nr:Iron-type alcohol dehydrogenase-like protein [Aduncisulcus paluster]
MFKDRSLPGAKKVIRDYCTKVVDLKYIDRDVLVSMETDIDEISPRMVLIVTGKKSAKENGSYKMLESILTVNSISHFLFDEVEQNPSISTVFKCVEQFQKETSLEKPDLIFAIGGGSPLDCAKAIDFAFCGVRDFTDKDDQPSQPLIPYFCIPTTAGTGSEITPYSILTNPRTKTKFGTAQRLTPTCSYIFPSFLVETPLQITASTVFDAISHLVEAGLTVKATPEVRLEALSGIRLLSPYIPQICAACSAVKSYNEGRCDGLERIKPFLSKLKNESFRLNTLHASSVGGVVISKAGTSLPHGLGYSLTTHLGLSHGVANAATFSKYLAFCCRTLGPQARDFVFDVLDILLRDCVKAGSVPKWKPEDLDKYLINIWFDHPIAVTRAQKEIFVSAALANKGKLAQHGAPVTKADIEEMLFGSGFLKVE